MRANNFPRQKCPVCQHDILKEERLRLGVYCFLSVHSKCSKCETEVACGFTGEEYIIVTHEEYKELSNAARNRTI